jgi:hypothetical protein
LLLLPFLVCPQAHWANSSKTHVHPENPKNVEKIKRVIFTTGSNWCLMIKELDLMHIAAEKFILLFYTLHKPFRGNDSSFPFLIINLFGLCNINKLELKLASIESL